ncbi:MAG: hypothetical protein ACOCU6_03520 [Nanoarchaeota archaeon]
MVSINKRQKELNDDLGSYIERRKMGGFSTNSFFKKVESLIPSKSNSGSVPWVNDVESTVYEKPSPKRFSLLSIFSRGSCNVREYESAEHDIDEGVKEEIEEVEHEIEDVDSESEEIERNRTSLFERLFSFLSSRPRNEAYEGDISEEVIREQVKVQEERDELYKETRDTLKVIHKWINRLSPNQVEAFKRSPDFQRYKNLLDRYNLIK